LALIPDHLLKTMIEETKELFKEVFQSYGRAIRQAIMEYILLSPQERKRLHILMLPRALPTATERALARGGYSISKYLG
jgi:dynein heavy chain, axonemal